MMPRQASYHTHPHSLSTSPSSSSLTSPKPLPPNPNINPFSPLSPENEPQSLIDPITHETSASTSTSRRPLITYNRSTLLRIALRAHKSRRWQVPSSMAPIDSWFGPTSTTQVADPAIASIGNPPGRNGGFGEGFGFGGGIGGRGIGRGARLGGTRKLQDNAPRDNSIQGHMGRFMAKNDKRVEPQPDREDNRENNRPKREGEWRRTEPLIPSRQLHHHQQQPQTYEEASPAWMDDSEAFPTSESSITGMEQDGLVHFVPGEDMIAAHRKDRESRSKPLVSFFGAPAASEPSRPTKTFNAADYLLPNKSVFQESPKDVPVESAFSSRFQKFFGGAPATGQSVSPTVHSPQETYARPNINVQATPDPPAQPPVRSPPIEAADSHRQSEKVDDHMAKLMGLLSTKSPQQGPSSSSQPPLFAGGPAPMSTGPPGFMQHQQRSFPPPPPQFVHEPPYHFIGGYPQHLSQRPPDAMQLLAHAQQPPQFRPPMPGMDHLPPNGQPFLPNGPTHDHLRDLQFSRAYPPKAAPPPMPLPMQGMGPTSPPPPFMGYHPSQTMTRPPPPQLNTAQQDMLATLFAGLPRPNQ